MLSYRLTTRSWNLLQDFIHKLANIRYFSSNLTPCSSRSGLNSRIICPFSYYPRLVMIYTTLKLRDWRKIIGSWGFKTGRKRKTPMFLCYRGWGVRTSRILGYRMWYIFRISKVSKLLIAPPSATKRDCWRKMGHVIEIHVFGCCVLNNIKLAVSFEKKI